MSSLNRARNWKLPASVTVLLSNVTGLNFFTICLLRRRSARISIRRSRRVFRSGAWFFACGTMLSRTLPLLGYSVVVEPLTRGMQCPVYFEKKLATFYDRETCHGLDLSLFDEVTCRFHVLLL